MGTPGIETIGSNKDTRLLTIREQLTDALVDAGCPRDMRPDECPLYRVGIDEQSFDIFIVELTLSALHWSIGDAPQASRVWFHSDD